MQETWVLSLDWEDPLEMEMAAHFSILAWKIQWTEEPGGLQSMGSQRVGDDLPTKQQEEAFKSVRRLQAGRCGTHPAPSPGT